MQAPPHACSLPVTQAPPARHATPTAQLLGQHLPGDARLQDKHDARQGGAVGDAAWPSTLGLGWFRREEWGDDLPQSVANQWRAHAANLPRGGGSVRRTKSLQLQRHAYVEICRCVLRAHEGAEWAV